MSSTLYRNGVVHSPADPFAEAVLVEDGVIAWLGANDSAASFASRADQVVDLDGLLVAPGFVDAHVHLLATGMALSGLDLTTCIDSREDVLAAVARSIRSAPSSGGLSALVHGHGWDESAWSERGAAIPTREDLDAAAQGAPVILVRADAHSSLVSSAFVDLAGLAHLAGYAPSGLVRGAAHTKAMEVLGSHGSERHAELTDLALTDAASRGIVSVHEMSAPGLDTREGLASLISRTASPSSGLAHVIGYRAELVETPDEAAALAAEIPGLTGLGGDLRVDGSLGSHTAALIEAYADLCDPGDPLRLGTLELSAEQIAAHLVSATAAGLQGAFHVIGDRAMREVLHGLELAAERAGDGPMRGAGHRLEHAEMITPDALDTLVRLGVRLSMQPVFDARWGGPEGMYAGRLGAHRVASMNSFAALAAEGVPLAFGSDSPVTPFDPWAAVRGALNHHNPDQQISARAAFRAHTRGGWRLAGLDHTRAGEIQVGSPAHLSIWDAESLVVEGPQRLFSSWSTDARAGTALLPQLLGDVGAQGPRCVQTLRSGHILHDELG